MRGFVGTNHHNVQAQDGRMPSIRRGMYISTQDVRTGVDGEKIRELGDNDIVASFLIRSEKRLQVLRKERERNA